MKLFQFNRLVPLFALAFFSTFSQASISVLFSPNGGVRDRINSEIAESKSSLYVAMYSLSDSKSIKTMKELATNGVDVKLILNQAQKDTKKASDLEESGIDVRYVNLVMHHKFAIVDNQTLVTGSQNWSVSADKIYDEDLLVFKNNREQIKSFQSEFNYLWNYSRDYEGPASAGVELEFIDNSSSNVIFTSENFKVVDYRGEWSFRKNVDLVDGVAGRAIIQAINEAQASIQIASAHFRRADFYEPLIEAINRGVKVEIVLDGQEYDGVVPNNLPENETEFWDEILATQGATVKYKMYSRYWNFVTAKQMHSKYMIVDNKKVLTGSFNWSVNSELNSIENLIILGSQEAKKYSSNFQNLMSYGEGEFKPLLADIKSSRGLGPCTFDSISLSPEEIETLRKTYASGACR